MHRLTSCPAFGLQAHAESCWHPCSLAQLIACLLSHADSGVHGSKNQTINNSKGYCEESLVNLLQRTTCPQQVRPALGFIFNLTQQPQCITCTPGSAATAAASTQLAVYTPAAGNSSQAAAFPYLYCTFVAVHLIIIGGVVLAKGIIGP